VVEVKTTEGNRPPRLSKDQKKGGKKFTSDRLERASDAKGHWQAKNAPGMKEAAKKVEKWLEDAPDIQYEVMEIKIENIDHGCKKKSVNPKPWEDRSNK